MKLSKHVPPRTEDTLPGPKECASFARNTQGKLGSTLHSLSASQNHHGTRFTPG